jgi:hypothetical protein
MKRKFDRAQEKRPAPAAPAESRSLKKKKLHPIDPEGREILREQRKGRSLGHAGHSSVGRNSTLDKLSPPAATIGAARKSAPTRKISVDLSARDIPTSRRQSKQTDLSRDRDPAPPSLNSIPTSKDSTLSKSRGSPERRKDRPLPSKIIADPVASREPSRSTKSTPISDLHSRAKHGLEISPESIDRVLRDTAIIDNGAHHSDAVGRSSGTRKVTTEQQKSHQARQHDTSSSGDLRQTSPKPDITSIARDNEVPTSRPQVIIHQCANSVALMKQQSSDTDKAGAKKPEADMFTLQAQSEEDSPLSEIDSRDISSWHNSSDESDAEDSEDIDLQDVATEGVQLAQLNSAVSGAIVTTYVQL